MTIEQHTADSQCAAILTHMRKGKPITGLDALRNYGCIHLPRRILDLKERGHAIESQWVKRDGKRFKEYWMPEEAR